MSDKYLSAAARHCFDAELLRKSNRWDNAGYLSGYAVECGLKAILAHVLSRNPKAFGHELHTLAGPALELALLLSPPKHQLRHTSLMENLKALAGWEPAWRYSATGELTEQMAETLVANAWEIFKQILIPLVLDGWEEVPK